METSTTMKNTLYILCFLSFHFFSIGQVTITNATFPDIGDTLYTVFDNEIENLDLGNPGANQTWDFSNLQAAFAQELIFKNAEEGNFFDQYPTAELFALGVNGDEVYYKGNSSTMLEIGRSTENPFGDAFEVFINFDDPSLFRKAPFSYGDDFVSDSESSITFPGSQLPDSLVANLPVVPDSIRITISEERYDTIDAWGTLKLPTAEYQVLREKRHIVRSVGISAFVLIGWIDIDPSELGELGNFFGDMDVYSYNFYAEDIKEIAAVVNLDEDGLATSVEYSSEEVIADIPVISPEQKEIIAYPNPTFGEIKFQFVNMGKNMHRIDVYDLLGKRLKSQEFDLSKSTSGSMDLSSLNKGTYLYSVYDQLGNKITTRRILVLAP